MEAEIAPSPGPAGLFPQIIASLGCCQPSTLLGSCSCWSRAVASPRPHRCISPQPRTTRVGDTVGKHFGHLPALPSWVGKRNGPGPPKRLILELSPSRFVFKALTSRNHRRQSSAGAPSPLVAPHHHPKPLPLHPPRGALGEVAVAPGHPVGVPAQLRPRAEPPNLGGAPAVGLRGRRLAVPGGPRGVFGPGQCPPGAGGSSWLGAFTQRGWQGRAGSCYPGVPPANLK